MAATNIFVQSNVGRDLLSAAARFKSEATAVWEYVVNSLQYVEPGKTPRVQVIVQPRKRLIRIEDNGMGMDVDGLSHYFTMHGENTERRAGRGGRGKFGTGKSAAFGIGTRLRVSTRRSGLLNEVELTRSMVEASDGREIPVSWIRQNEPTGLGNGTVITIEEIVLDKIRENSIIEYIERHLQAFRTLRPLVAVNDHVCEYREPDIVERSEFEPSTEQASVLGQVKLEVCVSRTPLEESDVGITITAGAGNLVGLEHCGISRKERGNYLLGHIDVPALESHESPIQPYDDGRTLQLNPAHPVVRVLLSFVGAKLEKVRLEQVDRYRAARQSEEARRLAKQAEKISQILNDDFRQVSEQIKEIRAAASSSTGAAPSLFGSTHESSDATDEWVEGIQQPGTLEATGSRSQGNGEGRKTIGAQRTGKPDENGLDSVDPAGGTGKQRRRPKGGFVVEYANLGSEEARSKYDPTRLTILINLDHPAVERASHLGGVEDPAFRRLSYEIAFSEYAMALGYEKAAQDPDMPPDDLLYEVRSTLNRVSRAAASLYE